MASSNMKLLIKKIVAIVGSVVLVGNLALFAFQVIDIKTFFYIIVFFGLLAFVYYKKTEDVS